MNTDALECALIAALLKDNDSIEKVKDELSLESFSVPILGACYDLLLKRREQGKNTTLEVLLCFIDDKDKDAIQEALVDSFFPKADVGSLCDALQNSFNINKLKEFKEKIDKLENANPIPQTSQSLKMLEDELIKINNKAQKDSKFRDFSTALDEALSDLEKLYQSGGGLRGLSSGFKGLDDYIGGLCSTDLLILAGRPAMGKTALGLNIATNVAEQGNAVLFFSMEMGAEQLTSRVLSSKTGIFSEKFRDAKLTAYDWELICKEKERLNSLPLFIDESAGLSISNLTTSARRYHKQHDIKLIVVDYLGLMSGKAENRVQEISEISRGLKALAKELDIPVIALSQLSRAVEQRDNKRPQLSDLRDSGSIEQDADAVMFVYREEYYHRVKEPAKNTSGHIDWQEKLEDVEGLGEVIIAKNRHGKSGKIELQFNKSTTTFQDS